MVIYVFVIDIDTQCCYKLLEFVMYKRSLIDSIFWCTRVVGID